jgi:hypothetical protein
VAQKQKSEGTELNEQLQCFPRARLLFAAFACVPVALARKHPRKFVSRGWMTGDGPAEFAWLHVIAFRLFDLDPGVSATQQ